MNNLARLPPMGLKCPPFVSRKLRQFAKGQECTLQMPGCNFDTSTTVLCHVRLFQRAGVGEKPHDFLGFHGCSHCHANESDAGYDDILLAVMRTQERVYREFGTLTP